MTIDVWPGINIMSKPINPNTIIKINILAIWCLGFNLLIHSLNTYGLDCKINPINTPSITDIPNV